MRDSAGPASAGASDQFRRAGRRAVAQLFLHDGVGTVVTRESLEPNREPDDIAALIALISRWSRMASWCIAARTAGARNRSFSIMLHDGIIVGCAALYPHSEEEAELACRPWRRINANGL